MDPLTPKDHAEAVALFRSEIVGPPHALRARPRSAPRRAVASEQATLPAVGRQGDAALRGDHAGAVVLRLRQGRPFGPAAQAPVGPGPGMTADRRAAQAATGHPPRVPLGVGAGGAAHPGG